MTCCRVALVVDDPAPVEIGTSLPGPVAFEVGEYVPMHVTDYPAYDGPTEVTPGGEAQVLGTMAHVLLSDIVINPIPSNYGVVSWDGSVLSIR